MGQWTDRRSAVVFVKRPTFTQAFQDAQLASPGMRTGAFPFWGHLQMMSAVRVFALAVSIQFSMYVRRFSAFWLYNVGCTKYAPKYTTLLNTP